MAWRHHIHIDTYRYKCKYKYSNRCTKMKWNLDEKKETINAGIPSETIVLIRLGIDWGLSSIEESGSDLILIICFFFIFCLFHYMYRCIFYSNLVFFKSIIVILVLFLVRKYQLLYPSSEFLSYLMTHLFNCAVPLYPQTFEFLVYNFFSSFFIISAVFWLKGIASQQVALIHIVYR